MGVPFKTNVLLQPTAGDCLVHFIEGPPFFVLSLDDVEVVSFERVRFSLRAFDITFLLKDYTRQPIQINSVPIDALETLQEWLTKSDVVYYINSQPFNWTTIMEQIRAKTFKQFLDEGGWSFLEKPEEQLEAEIAEDDIDGFVPEEDSTGYSNDDDLSEEDSSSGSGGESSDAEEEEEEDWERKARDADRKWDSRKRR